MDILKLCEKVLESEEVQGIPVVYVYLVMNCVIEAINSGECFYPTEQEGRYVVLSTNAITIYDAVSSTATATADTEH